MGASSDEGAENAAQGGPEKSKIKIAVLPTTDIVPLYLAIDSGYFKQEGLDVETITGKSGSDCVAKLTSGEVDIAFSSYTPFFVAKSKNAADIKLVADATSAGPGAYPVITVKDSPVQSIRDMAGRRVGITARLTMSHLMVASVLKTHGIDPEGIAWVELPFGQMAERLRKTRHRCRVHRRAVPVAGIPDGWRLPRIRHRRWPNRGHPADRIRHHR